MSYRVGRSWVYLSHKDKSEIRGRVNIQNHGALFRFTVGCRVQFLAQE